MQELHLDTFYIGDVLKVLKTFPDKSVRCVVTSPPYFGLRDYNTSVWIGGNKECNHSRAKNIFSDATRSITLSGGTKNQIESHRGRKQYRDICLKCGAKKIDLQIGLEKTPKLYIKKMVKVFAEIKRILKDDGTLWLNIGDSYASSTMTKHGGQRKNRDQTPMSGISRTANSIGLKPKDLIGIPWMLAFALRDAGWYLRADIIWHKVNPMPESVNDRPSKAHEYIFLLTKSRRYYYDAIAIRQPLAQSVLNDKRFWDEDYETARLERGYPAQSSHVAGLLKRNGIINLAGCCVFCVFAHEIKLLCRENSFSHLKGDFISFPVVQNHSPP